jgi:hypothetical protein
MRLALGTAAHCSVRRRKRGLRTSSPQTYLGRGAMGFDRRWSSMVATFCLWRGEVLGVEERIRQRENVDGVMVFSPVDLKGGEAMSFSRQRGLTMVNLQFSMA